MEIIEGAGALTRINSTLFVRQWAELAARCPWTTAYQGPEFVRTWYDTYRERFSPLVLVWSRSETLVGLLTLATERETGNLVVAGAHQAEYQCWLAEPQVLARCIAETAPVLKSRLASGGHLQLRSLPRGFPLDSLQASVLGSHAYIREYRRPLMRIDRDRVQASLRKKSNKSRMNRLKREGTLEFSVLAGREAVARVLPQIIEQYDLRQAVTHRAVPFRDDSRKEAFHLALASHEGLLHSTVLTLDGRIVAAHVGVRSGREVHVGVICHAPEMARNSPGKLHLLLLAEQLLEDGVDTLDLTLGDDAWKERFADAHDAVFDCALYSSPSRAMAVRARSKLRRMTRYFLGGWLGLDLDRWRLHLSKGSDRGGDLGTSDVSALGSRLRVYWRPLSSPTNERAPTPAQADATSKLLDRYFVGPGDADFRALGRCLDALQAGCQPFFHEVGAESPLLAWKVKVPDSGKVSVNGLDLTLPGVGHLIHEGMLGCWRYLTASQAQAFVRQLDRGTPGAGSRLYVLASEDDSALTSALTSNGYVLDAETTPS